MTDLSGHWLARDGYLQPAVDAGLVVPSDFGSSPALHPDEPISHLEVAVIASRFLHEQGAAMLLPDGALPYADAGTIPAWASEAVAFARSAGVLGGFPDGSFAPSRPLTRAEPAVVAVRLLQTAAAEGLLAAPAGLPQPDRRQVPVWEANPWTVSTPRLPSGVPSAGSGGASGPRLTFLTSDPDGSLGTAAPGQPHRRSRRC